MLSVDLGLRSFRKEQGHYPETLKSFERDTETALPIDPLTGKLFVYRGKFQWKFFRKTEVGFDLYSPGPRPIDHGGKFGTWPQAMEGHVDFCLEWANYQEHN